MKNGVMFYNNIGNGVQALKTMQVFEKGVKTPIFVTSHNLQAGVQALACYPHKLKRELHFTYSF